MADDIRLLGVKPDAHNQVLSSDLASEISKLVPDRLQSHLEWTLKYSLEQNGASLRTLYELVRPEKPHEHHGYVLAVKDSYGNVFGAYMNEHPHPSDGTRYYGNGDCFLWKTSVHHGSARFEGFPYTGVNDFVIFNTSKFLSLGGGDGHYGLWIDDYLNNGVSQRSLTFGNDPLSLAGEKFQVNALEVWRV